MMNPSNTVEKGRAIFIIILYQIFSSKIEIFMILILFYLIKKKRIYSWQDKILHITYYSPFYESRKHWSSLQLGGIFFLNHLERNHWHVGKHLPPINQIMSNQLLQAKIHKIQQAIKKKKRWGGWSHKIPMASL